ncbi:MAG: hypothetical protein ACYSX1_10750 [Planctomycetota bacterium]|jgi:hypothetical protein
MQTAYPTGDSTGVYELSPIPPHLECMDLADLYSTGPPDGHINTGDLCGLICPMVAYYPSGDPNGLYEIPCQMSGYYLSGDPNGVYEGPCF